MEKQELEILKIEDILCIVFAILAFINLYGNQVQKKYVITRQYQYEEKANQIFTFTLIVTFLIYIYYLIRNYKNYKEVSKEKKELYRIKLMGSIFVIAGAICLLYFQTHNKTSVGAPSI